MRAKFLSLSDSRIICRQSRREIPLGALLTLASPCSSFCRSTRAQDSHQTGDPVADAARRSREAKLNTAKPKKVYTDDDISRRKPAPSPTDPTGAAANPNAAHNRRSSEHRRTR